MKVGMVFDKGGMSDNGPAPINPVMPGSDCCPEFTVRGEEELEVPEYGTMTIRYRVMEERESNRKHDTKYSCTICVCEIVSAKEIKEDPEAPAKSGSKETSDALDKLAKEEMED